MMKGMGITHKRLFAGNKTLGSPTSVHKLLHKKARGLKYFPLAFSIPFMAVSILIIMRDIAL